MLELITTAAIVASLLATPFLPKLGSGKAFVRPPAQHEFANTPGVISQVPASPDIGSLAGQLEGAPANTGGIFDLLPVGGSISATLGGAPIGGAGQGGGYGQGGGGQ